MIQIKFPRLARSLTLLLALSLTSWASVWAQGAPGVPQRLPTTLLRAGMHQITAQVAQTDAQRAVGLMHRKDMPQHEGMLFVFEQPSQQCFWMRNTLLPLSIAFLADDGSIVNIAEMKPLDETSTCSEKPVRYALEMNKGWFSQRGLKPGFKLQGAPFVASGK
jgi:uncharacterized membrane protein (UPF0127 family)